MQRCSYLYTRKIDLYCTVYIWTKYKCKVGWVDFLLRSRRDRFVVFLSKLTKINFKKVLTYDGRFNDCHNIFDHLFESKESELCGNFIKIF
jgi:hypothetical protein